LAAHRPNISRELYWAPLSSRVRLHLSEALRTGFVFGTIEAITPVIGWAVGLAASGYITAIDHWIALTLLAAIGGKMIWESARRPDERRKPNRHSLKILVATAIGTSIDAMAVGVTLAFIDADIVVTALAIGVMTGRQPLLCLSAIQRREAATWPRVYDHPPRYTASPDYFGTALAASAFRSG
jgi:Putative manganese efflux pump